MHRFVLQTCVLLVVGVVGWAWSCVSVSAQTPPAASVVTNGDAETLDARGAPEGWSLYLRKGKAVFGSETDERTPGRKVARLELLDAEANFTLQIGRAAIPRQAEESTWLFTAEARSETAPGARVAAYFCLGPADALKVVSLPHNAGWQKLRAAVTVPAGQEFGRLDFNGGGGPAVIRIDAVRLVRLPPEEAQAENAARRRQEQQPETALTLNAGEPVLVRKILPLDCRLVRGFAHAPVDGRTDTRHAKGGLGEWSGLGGLPAVNYRLFNGNNGLHILLPEGGFDALQLRGSWRGKVYADYEGLLPPEDGRATLCEVEPRAETFRTSFDPPVRARRLSFFYADTQENRALADVAFFQVRRGASFQGGGASAALEIGDDAPADEALLGAIRTRFGPGARTFRLREGPGRGVTLREKESLHLITPLQDPAWGVAAVSVELDVARVELDGALTVSVQDVLDPRREAMGADFALRTPGRYTITLDVPDQAFLPPREQWGHAPRLEDPLAPPPAVWLSLAAGAGLELKGVKVTLHRIPRADALVEAGTWRKFLVRGLFSTMSEPRPWMHLVDQKPVREQIAADVNIKPYVTSLVEVLENVELARLLLPADDVARQYQEWVYQNMERRKPRPPPRLPDVPGAPGWAVAVRETWRSLEASAAWWLANRLVPNGEFGGGVNDDTDLFQVWQCLPMIESAPLGDALKDAAARLSELAVTHKLEEGINRQTMDALHAYEEGVNHLALCAWWFYGDPVHFGRAMDSARSAMKLMVDLPDGRVHFGGDHVGIEQARKGFEKLGASPGGGNWAPARLFLHPMYVVAWYNRSPAVIERFSRWGTTWANYQKPGEFVGKVDIATGKPILSAKPTATGTAVGPVDEWLALYQVTGDAKWLTPFKQLLDSGGYTGTTTAYGRCAHALVEWGDPYQEIVRRRFSGSGSGYAGFFLTKDRGMLDSWLNNSASWFGRFRYMNAEAEQKTDRVLTMNASAPISCYLGDAPNRNRFLNFIAVSYEGLRGEDFAALVWDAGPAALRVAIHNFTDRPLAGRMRVWRLDHGRYKVAVGPDADDDAQIDEGAAEVTMAELGRYSAIPLALPPRRTTVVQAEQVERLDDLLARADLALSPLDSGWRPDGAFEARVHNIGSSPAREARVALLRDGRPVEEVILPEIEAPLDLHPRRVSVRFKDARPGDVVVADPAGLIPEIAEHNNRLAVPAKPTKP